jgi:hypothetical protein
MNKKIIFLIPLIMMLASPMLVFAAGDNIRVTPVGKPDGEMAIITSSPASLEIYVTNAQQTRNNIWLLLVLDNDTYNGLTSITLAGTQGPALLAKSSFTAITVNSGKIPLQNDGNYTGGGYTYPGCTNTAQYSVGAILSQMSQVFPTNAVHYGLVYAFDSINTTAKTFTVTVNSPHINVLVLAQGCSGTSGKLNSNSPFSGSSILVTPELGPILMAMASFSALGLYAVKRRRK